MRKFLFLGVMIALTAVNIGTVAINLSTSSNAEVAGMARRDLVRDRDFRYAVEDIIKECKVEGENLTCPPDTRPAARPSEAAPR